MRLKPRVVPSVLLALLCSAAASPVRAAEPVRVIVDGADLPRRIVHVRERVPVDAGECTLYYPKWIPGTHGPTGPIADVVGLEIHANGAALRWWRDPADMYAFHVNVPDGVDALDVTFDYLPPIHTVQNDLAILNWNEVVLYPAGPDMRDLVLEPQLVLPEGWDAKTALPVVERDGARMTFTPASLETLVDSPVLAGRYMQELRLGPDSGIPHYLVTACEVPEALDLPDWVERLYGRMVVEADALFGGHPYGSYRILVAMGDYMGGGAIEHHESCYIAASGHAFTDGSLRKRRANVVPHEFVHAWNGKYRRPAGMVTRDFQAPERTNLLWVYEGLTNYLAFVLTARAGFWDEAYARKTLRDLAEWADHREGRAWRSLEDTAVSAQVLFGARHDWGAWRRRVDVYNEGILLWLEVDAIIRQETRGARSLDDFCRRFYAAADGVPAVKPYSYDDLLAALDAVAPYDWRTYFGDRVYSPSEKPPLGGLERCGWRLAYGEKPDDYALGGALEFRPSLGLWVNAQGHVTDVTLGSPADRAGLAPQMKIVAVNDRIWSLDALRAAVNASADSDTPIRLIAEQGKSVKIFELDYHGGPAYPRLERIEDVPDLLPEILKPLAAPVTEPLANEAESVAAPAEGGAAEATVETD